MKRETLQSARDRARAESDRADMYAKVLRYATFGKPDATQSDQIDGARYTYRLYGARASHGGLLHIITRYRSGDCDSRVAWLEGLARRYRETPPIYPELIAERDAVYALVAARNRIVQTAEESAS
jgi:hypothetical protein